MLFHLRSFAKTFGPQYQGAGSKLNDAAAVNTLAGLAGLSIFIYFCALTQRYSLFEWYREPRLTLYGLSKDAPLIYVSLLAALAIQGALYWLGWRTAQRAGSRLAWIVVLAGAVASATVLLCLYPFDAADVFDNIMHGRILGVYGANPFQTVARQFPDDPFFSYIAWNWAPSAYGPLWETLAGVTARLAGNGIIANVLAFKLLAGAFWIGSVGLVAVILRRVAPERALAGVLLLAWNPLVLYETFGNGHNDIALVFWLLAAVWALLHRRHTLAILALVAGALFKFIPALLLPAAGLIALRQLPDRGARLRFMAVAVIASVALVALVYAPFWQGSEILTIGRRSRLFTASLPAMFYTWFKATYDWQEVAFAISLITASLTSGFALWQAWCAGREPSWLSFTRAAINILLFYLLVTCPWFQQWYALWPLGLASLLPAGPQMYLVLLLGGYSLFSKHLVFGPLFFRIQPLPKAWREIWFGPVVLAVPWFYALYTIWISRQEKRKTCKLTIDTQHPIHDL